MSKVRADKLVNRAGTGAVELTEGATLASGKYISGAGSLNITGVSTIGGNVTIGGTLTYDDVTNIDSVGLITARAGIQVSANGINAVGVVTATGFTGNINSPTGVSTVGTALTAYADNLSFNGLLREACKVTAGKLSDNSVINLDNGMVHFFTTQESTTCSHNIITTTGINTDMSVGDTITVTVTTTAAAGGFSANWLIDGAAVTEEWNGGSAPSAGGSSGYDMYSLNIIKTASATYTVLANVVNFA